MKKFLLGVIPALIIGLSFAGMLTLVSSKIADKVVRIELPAAIDREISQQTLKTPAPATVDFDKLQQVSVKVVVPGGSGSGVVVVRYAGADQLTYVVTAGHVVEGVKEATIYQEMRWGGHLIATREYRAKVIAYSAPDDQDLAILLVDGNFSCGAKFYTDLVPTGSEIIHVGSTLGIYNSVSRGIISQTDRDILGTGIEFDQTSCMSYPGSSGGGVFLPTGECIGILVRGAGPGLNFIVPARRVRAWAKSIGMEYIIDPNTDVTHHKGADSLKPTKDDEASAIMPLPPGGPE
jgi:S1-C subfamily serine protease